MANEKIVATAIYYYDSKNIEGDALNFRQSVEMVSSLLRFRHHPSDWALYQDILEFEQDDDEGATGMYGIGRDDPMVQDAGSIQTPVSVISCQRQCLTKIKLDFT